MNNSGWIKLHKKILDWEWYDDTNTFRVFFHLLLKANWKATKWHGETLNPGELITGRKTLAKETHLTEMQVRVALEKLKITNEITITSTNNFSLIKLNKWDEYQVNNQQDNQRITNEQPTDNQPVTTDKEYKKLRTKEIKNNTIALSREVKVIDSGAGSPPVSEPLVVQAEALLQDTKPGIQIIGLFARAKNIRFDTRQQLQEFIKRNVRAANALAPYPADRIAQTMQWLIKNADYKWTLETVAKHIDERPPENKSKFIDLDSV